MTTNNKTLTAAVALTALDHSFMASTYPAFAGDKWDPKMGGNMPAHKQHMDAATFGVRLGSKQALALALTLRADGSTAAQRTYAGQGKTQNNVGGLQDLLRQHTGSAKLVAGQPVTFSLANGAKVQVVSNKAGHVAATIVSPPTVAVVAKTAAKVAAKASDKAKDAPKGDTKAVTATK